MEGKAREENEQRVEKRGKARDKKIEHGGMGSCEWDERVTEKNGEYWLVTCELSVPSFFPPFFG